VATADVVIVREWDAEAFHRRVLDFESQGYRARRESYSIAAEMNPETGEIIHLRSIELLRLDRDRIQAG